MLFTLACKRAPTHDLHCSAANGNDEDPSQMTFVVMVTAINRHLMRNAVSLIRCITNWCDVGEGHSVDWPPITCL